MTERTEPIERLENLVRRLSRLSYPACRRALRSGGPHGLPGFFYKYRSVDPSDADSVRHLSDVLVGSKLWLSPPGQLNDPFELSVKVIVEGTVAERRKVIDELLKDDGVRYRDREAHRARKMRTPVPELQREIQRIHDVRANSTGLYSLSTNPLSIQMWSYYADGFTGLCLQFDVARDIRVFTNAYKVDYCCDRPIINFVMPRPDGAARPLWTKHIHWKHEDEWRLIRLDEAGTYLPFAPQALRGIILGPRITPKILEVVKTLLGRRVESGKPMPSVYRVDTHDAKYRLLLRREPGWR